MAQYIDKDALVAEIERQKSRLKPFEGIGSNTCGRIIKYFDKLLSFLDTLEVKEVELTWKDVREICIQSVLVEIDLGGLVSDERHYTEVLKRFKEKNHE